MLILDKKNFRLEKIDVFVSSTGEDVKDEIFKLSELIRDKINHLKVYSHFSSESRNKQIKKAKKLKAKYICILCKDKINSKKVLVKYLRYPFEEVQVDWGNIVQFLQKRM